MREGLLAPLIVLAAVTTAAAQTSRFEIGPVLRLDRVFFEGNATGNTAAAGIAATLRISRMYAIEAEMTQGSRRVDRSYEGWFVSYATNPAATREDVERLAPTARRSLGYGPGAGTSVALAAGGDISRTVRVSARAGVAARRYAQTSTYRILSIPDGVDAERVARDHESSSSERWRSGLLFGVDSAIALTPHLRLVPEVRFVYGGPAQVGDKYRECGLGLRALWQF